MLSLESFTEPITNESQLEIGRVFLTRYGSNSDICRYLGERKREIIWSTQEHVIGQCEDWHRYSSTDLVDVYGLSPLLQEIYDATS